MSDKEILDWMEANLNSLSRSGNPQMDGRNWFGQALNLFRNERKGQWFRIHHRTIREAVEEAAKP